MPGTVISPFQLPSRKVKEEKLAAWTPVGDGVVERDLAWVVVFEACRAEVDFEAEHVFLVEAGIDVGEIDEAAQEEAGSNHEDE